MPLWRGEIRDVSLIVNEVIDSILKKKEKWVLCKLDIEKAYDQINWNFLIIVLFKMGFKEKWLGWIKWYISTSSFSVMLNGSPKGFFRSLRGLRQGDPLSPLPFCSGARSFSPFGEQSCRRRLYFWLQVLGEGWHRKIDHTLVVCR